MKLTPLMTLIWSAMVLSSATCVEGDEPRLNVIFVLDISSSMKDAEFEGYMETIGRWLNQLPDSSQVGVIEFADEAKMLNRSASLNDAARKQLLKSFEAIIPSGRTNTLAGLKLAIDEAARIKKENPGSRPLLILLTDGKDDPPAGEEPFSSARLTQYLTELNLKVGVDLRLHYAYVGMPNKEFKDEIEQLGGQILAAVDYNIGQFSIDPQLIRLGKHMPGDWSQDASLSITAKNCRSAGLEFGPILVQGLPSDARFNIDPSTVELTDGVHQTHLTIDAKRIPPGEYSGLLMIKVIRGLASGPSFVQLQFEVEQPIISVTPDRIQLTGVKGQVYGPGGFSLIPNEAAARMNSAVRLSLDMFSPPRGLSFAMRAPHEERLLSWSDDSSMVHRDATLFVSDRTVVELFAFPSGGIPPTASTTSGNISLKANSPYVKIEPSTIPVSLTINAIPLKLRSTGISIETNSDRTLITQRLHVENEIPSVGIKLTLPTHEFDAISESDPKPLKVRLLTRNLKLSAEQRDVAIQIEVKEARSGKWTFEIPVTSDNSGYQPSSIKVVMEIEQGPLWPSWWLLGLILLAAAVIGAVVVWYTNRYWRHPVFHQRIKKDHGQSASQYDVFLSYNRKDKDVVHGLAIALQKCKIGVWLDEWEIRPGQRWRGKLEEAVKSSKVGAVLIGKNGLGPWQNSEMAAFQSEAFDRGMVVIPVLLPGAPQDLVMPLFLKEFMYVDFRRGITDEGVSWLISGIKSNLPDGCDQVSQAPVSPESSTVFNKDKFDVCFDTQTAGASDFASEPPDLSSKRTTT